VIANWLAARPVQLRLSAFQGSYEPSATILYPPAPRTWLDPLRRVRRDRNRPRLEARPEKKDVK
jgi:hypothetical protein